MSRNLSGSGGRSSHVGYATSTMLGNMFSSFQNTPNNQHVANALSITYQANTGSGGGSLKRQFKSIPLFSSTTNNQIKLQFSVNGLINFAYRHSPVVSMSNKSPLEEIITTQPLINLYVNDETHIYYLTYVFYKTEDNEGNPIINGTGYITTNFIKNSVRSVFNVTSSTTHLLANELFGLEPVPLTKNVTENLYLFNNNDGQTANLSISVEQVGNDRIVTIQS